TCLECNHSSCVACGGRPEHVYSTEAMIPPDMRSNPTQFASSLKESLPMRLYISWLSVDALNGVIDRMKPSPKTVNVELVKTWTSIVSATLAPSEHRKVTEFRFSTLKRQEIWSAVYVSDGARLVLSMDTKSPQWLLFVNAPKGTSPSVREALKNPVAQMQVPVDGNMTLSDSLISGIWSLFVPALFKFKVSVTGEGTLVDSWEAKLGLEGKYKDSQVWSHWAVKNASNDIELPFGGIDGTYRAIGKCGTAMDYLHIRTPRVRALDFEVNM
ncbi:hypothetical protein HDU99_009596, partial [Rhizoclosmatium hyalinum]